MRTRDEQSIVESCCEFQQCYEIQQRASPGKFKASADATNHQRGRERCLVTRQFCRLITDRGTPVWVCLYVKTASVRGSYRETRTDDET